MSVRVRLVYEKRGGACFVPHIALAPLFTRAAWRAGLIPAMTEGFSPHAKMSFGPELPAGVVALREPVDIHLETAPDGLTERWNTALPEGFRVLSSFLLQEGAPALGKECRAALYWVRSGVLPCEALIALAQGHYGEAVMDAGGETEELEGWGRLVLSAPAQNGVGGWVKTMIASGDLRGWQDINIVRAAIGAWNGTQIELPGHPAP